MNFNHAGTLTFDVPIVDAAGLAPDPVNRRVESNAPGATIFTGANGANSYSGATLVNVGTVLAGTAYVFSPNSPYTIAAPGILDLDGYSQTVQGLTNAGLVQMASSLVPTVLTIRGGNYVGQGGTIAMNTYLGADGSVSDKLVIDRGATSGTTLLRFTNAGGPGAQTTGNGILVVSAVNGGTTASGSV